MKWTLQHTEPYGVSAAPYSVSVAPYDESAAPYGVSAAPYGVLALQDTHGTSRGPEGPSQGGVLYMKKFYGLELLKNHF